MSSNLLCQFISHGCIGNEYKFWFIVINLIICGELLQCKHVLNMTKIDICVAKNTEECKGKRYFDTCQHIYLK